MKFSKLVLLCCLSIFAFGAKEVYFIKASGDLGKELSEMAKQYAEQKGGSVEVFIDEDPRKYKDTRLIKTGVDRKGRYSASLGKEIYEQKCASCHGMDIEKRPSGTKSLKDMEAKDIEDSIVLYRTDTTYGKSTKTVMQGIAKSLSNNDLGAIVAYIKGKDAYVNELQENKPVSTEKKQGSYLR